MAVVVAYTGACALSLAGFIGPLPLRRVMVGLAAAVFTIRGFTLVPQLLAETGHFDPADGGTHAQLLASAASLGLGILYCMGLARHRCARSGRAADAGAVASGREAAPTRPPRRFAPPFRGYRCRRMRPRREG